jgi:hypothetical protein
MKNEIKVGDRVSAGVGQDYDEGRVDVVDAGQATVSWDSLVVTTQPLDMLAEVEEV